MGIVVQLFPAKQNNQGLEVSRQAIKENFRRMELRHKIWELERTVKSFQEVAEQLENQADKFVARVMAKDTQRDLDKLVAEYTGTFGVYIAL